MQSMSNMLTVNYRKSQKKKMEMMRKLKWVTCSLKKKERKKEKKKIW
jgi:hypothetical protein